VEWLRRRYGAGPAHLVLLVSSFAIAAAAIVRFFDPGSEGTSILIWFVAAIVVHDLVLFPLYSLLDLLGRRALGGLPVRPPVSVRNHLRVPAALSGLLFLVYLPLILKLGSATYRAAAGVEPSGYFTRWLLVTAILFGISAIAYVVRLRRAARDSRKG